MNRETFSVSVPVFVNSFRPFFFRGRKAKRQMSGKKPCACFRDRSAPDLAGLHGTIPGAKRGCGFTVAASQEGAHLWPTTGGQRVCLLSQDVGARTQWRSSCSEEDGGRAAKGRNAAGSARPAGVFAAASSRAEAITANAQSLCVWTERQEARFGRQQTWLRAPATPLSLAWRFCLESGRVLLQRRRPSCCARQGGKVGGASCARRFCRHSSSLVIAIVWKPVGLVCERALDSGCHWSNFGRKELGRRLAC